MKPTAGTTASAAIAYQRRIGRKWPWLIGGLLAVHVGGMMFAVTVATRDRSFVVLPNYYQRALQWDQQKAAAHATDLLGWSRAIELGEYDVATATRQVTLHLTDRDGKAVTGLQVRMVASPEMKPALTQKLTLHAAGDGAYVTTLGVTDAGVWHLDIDASGPAQQHYVATAMPWIGR